MYGFTEITTLQNLQRYLKRLDEAFESGAFARQAVTAFNFGDARNFGLVANSSADQSAVLAAALASAWTNSAIRYLELNDLGDVYIANEVLVTLTANIDEAFGIRCRGTRLVSQIANSGKDVLRIVVTNAATVRLFSAENLKIKGSGTERDGLAIYCPGAAQMPYFYNFTLFRVVVQGCGRDGIHLEGSIFEGELLSCRSRDNDRHGYAIGHDANSPQGVCSSINAMACIAGGNGVDNSGHGLDLLNQFYSINWFGGYFVSNRGRGINAPNGILSIVGAGFEDNCLARGAFSTANGDNAAIRIDGSGLISGCTGTRANYQAQLFRLFAPSTGALTVVNSQMVGTSTERMYHAGEAGGSSFTLTMIDFRGGRSTTEASAGTNVITDGVAKLQRFNAPSEAATLQVANGASRHCQITSATAYTALTVALPTAPFQGQEISVGLSGGGSVGTLSVTAAATVNNAPTSMANGSFFKMKYFDTGSGQAWYRIG